VGGHGKEPKPVSDRATQYMRETVLFCRGSAGSSRRPSARRITKSSREEHWPGTRAFGSPLRLLRSSRSTWEKSGRTSSGRRDSSPHRPREEGEGRAPKGSVRGSTLTLSAPAVLAAPACDGSRVLTVVLASAPALRPDGQIPPGLDSLIP